jgi:hypothetical protein
MGAILTLASFFCFALAFAADVARRRATETWGARGGMLALAALAAFMSASRAPAVVLPMVLVYESFARRGREASALVIATIVPALLVVGWREAVVAGDALAFGVVAAVGSAMGVAFARVTEIPSKRDDHVA